MHLIIKRSSWSENDWLGTEYHNDPDVTVKLKLRVLKQLPNFDATKILD